MCPSCKCRSWWEAATHWEAATLLHTEKWSLAHWNPCSCCSPNHWAYERKRMSHHQAMEISAFLRLSWLRTIWARLQNGVAKVNLAQVRKLYEFICRCCPRHNWFTCTCHFSPGVTTHHDLEQVLPRYGAQAKAPSHEHYEPRNIWTKPHNIVTSL